MNKIKKINQVELRIKRLKKIEDFNNVIGDYLGNFLEKIVRLIEIILCLTIFCPLILTRVIVKNRLKKLRRQYEKYEQEGSNE